MLLTDLADAARKSGLKVVELDGWKTNYSAGGFEPEGVLCHHTGSYDGVTDATDDLGYAKWLAFTGRSDLPPPLCNLAFSAECVVYVCAAGNANHAGQAKASGPMPAASDGNVIYIGIEAMNSGTQGWGSKGHTADGEEITQGEGYARLCAALDAHYGWPASHDRGHKETSVTGKWDPGGLDMDTFRERIAELINTIGDDDMANYAAQLDQIQATVEAIQTRVDQIGDNTKKRDQALRKALREQFGVTDDQLDKILAEVDQ